MEVVSLHRTRGAAVTAAPLDTTFPRPSQRLRVLLAEDPHDVETLRAVWGMPSWPTTIPMARW